MSVSFIRLNLRYNRSKCYSFRSPWPTTSPESDHPPTICIRFTSQNEGDGSLLIPLVSREPDDQSMEDNTQLCQFVFARNRCRNLAPRFLYTSNPAIRNASQIWAALHPSCAATLSSSFLRSVGILNVNCVAASPLSDQQRRVKASWSSMISPMSISNRSTLTSLSIKDLLAIRGS